MEVRSKMLYGLDEIEDLAEYDGNLTVHELIFSNITNSEKEILNECGIEYTEFNDKVKIFIKNYNFFQIIKEERFENEGIYLKKTENYYEFINREYSVYKETEETKNLVISKEGFRAEFILFMG